MDEKTKKIAIYAGLAVAVFIFVLLLRKASGGSGGTMYTTGISGNNAAAISVAGINASAQVQEAALGEQLGIAQAADQLAYGKDTNATHLAIAKNNSAALQDIEDKFTAAEQAVALNTNQTNENIVANLGSTTIGMQPSWLDRLLGITSFSNQFGGNSYTGGSPAPAQSLFQAFASIFGGGGGGGGAGAAGGFASMFGGGAGAGAGAGGGLGAGSLFV